jgi:VanZ family protein
VPLTDRRTAVFAAVVLISLVVLFVPRTPSEQGIPHVDKLVHGALFAALAASTRWRFGSHVGGLVAVLAYAAGSELVQQHWLAQRDGDVRDFAADAVGALLGWLLARRVLSQAR